MLHKSCGYAVPNYTFESNRNQLTDFFGKKEALDDASDTGVSNSGLRRYWGDKNAMSIDGLPGLGLGVSYAEQFGIKEDAEGKGWGARTSTMAAKGLTGVDAKTFTAFCAGLVVAFLVFNVASVTRTLTV